MREEGGRFEPRFKIQYALWESRTETQSQVLHRHVQRFRAGLEFKAHRLCVSRNSRLESSPAAANLLVPNGRKGINEYVLHYTHYTLHTTHYTLHTTHYTTTQRRHQVCRHPVQLLRTCCERGGGVDEDPREPGIIKDTSWYHPRKTRSCFIEMCSGSEAGSNLRLIDSCCESVARGEEGRFHQIFKFNTKVSKSNTGI